MLQAAAGNVALPGSGSTATLKLHGSSSTFQCVFSKGSAELISQGAAPREVLKSPHAFVPLDKQPDVATSPPQPRHLHKTFSSTLSQLSGALNAANTVFLTSMDSVAFTEKPIERNTGIHYIEIKTHSGDGANNIMGIGAKTDGSLGSGSRSAGAFVFPLHTLHGGRYIRHMRHALHTSQERGSLRLPTGG